ncbi:MAG: 4-hydroxy-3-methylbut-2-enyl diphosphate reductase [Clostridia bacterium]
MIIYLGKDKGFCKGVASAVARANKYINQPNTYTFGELVHNNRVVQDLQSKGIKPIEDITKLHNGDTLIIRAHGASPTVFDYCMQNNIKVIDATCPYVKIIQIRAKQYYDNGYKIVLIGSSTHPEIIGINGWCDNTALITDGTQIIDLNKYSKVLVMFQTTYNAELVKPALGNLLTDSVKMLEIFNTICYTTLDRQEFAKYIASMSDLAIVVGDKQSSNTNKLFSLASKYAKAILIENANEIVNLPKNLKICIIAGASTPKELMEEVLSQMVAEAKNNGEVAEVKEVIAKNLFTETVDKMSQRRYKKGSKLKGKVIEKHDDGVSLQIPNSKGDGFIPNEELAVENWEIAKENINVGDTIECMVTSTDKRVLLSKKEIDILYKDDELVDGIVEGKSFDLVMAKAVKGGLLSRLGSYTVFVPASQIREGFVKNLEQYVGKTLSLLALPDGVDSAKKKIVASHREFIIREKKEKEDKFWNNIEVNEIVEGKVVRFSNFGAFVEVNHFDCLAHLSDLSWNPIKEPADILELNKTYDFLVLKLDRDTKRVSLGYKQLQPHPWAVAAEKFPIGAVVKGKVARILPFGAFIELDKGIDGLLHISNVSWEWLGDINEALKVGDEIDVQVIDFDIENRRITLSRKATMERPVEVERPPHKKKEDDQE